MSPNDNVYKFRGYCCESLEISPEWTDGYKVNTGKDIICLTTADGFGIDSSISIDLQTAKLMIEALQEIIDYVEDNI